jgi:hypothetical protein
VLEYLRGKDLPGEFLSKYPRGGASYTTPCIHRSGLYSVIDYAPGGPFVDAETAQGEGFDPG